MDTVRRQNTAVPKDRMNSLPGGEHTASLDGPGNYALFDVRATDRTTLKA